MYSSGKLRPRVAGAPGAAGLLVLAVAVAVALAFAPAGRAADSPSRWCGPGETAVDLPDTSPNAFQIHVVYAYPADATSRFATLAAGIARDVAAIDTWWRAQDSSHAPRWDLASFAGCDTAFGQLDISSVRLPRPLGGYATLDALLDRLGSDLSAAPTNLSDPDKKYIVFFDGLIDQPRAGFVVCGQSPSNVLGGGSDAYAGIYLMSPCGDGLGAATNTAGTITHELVHNLGALASPGPPHACPTSAGHPCDSDSDVLSALGEYGRSLNQLQLDIGRDDYYAHSGSWWDIQDSLFLERVGQTVGVPTGPTSLSATNDGGAVAIRWQPATSSNGAITYRVYRDGALIGTVTDSGVSDAVEPVSTHTWTIRAIDALGYFGPLQSITYTLTATTATTTGKAAAIPAAAPRAAQALRATKTRTGILLRWRAGTGKPRPIGYRVARNGKLYAQLVTGTSLAAPKAKAKGSWVVYAVDVTGRVSGPSNTVRVA